MKCEEVRTLLSEISDQSVLSKSPAGPDMDFLSTNGYISRMSQQDYDNVKQEVAQLEQLQAEQEKDQEVEEQQRSGLTHDMDKSHSFFLRFEKAKKEALERQIETEKSAFDQQAAKLSQEEMVIGQIIAKKSELDRLLKVDGVYLAVTDFGLQTLKELNLRNYRVDGMDFTDYIQQDKNIWHELVGIGQRASFFVSKLENEVPKASDYPKFHIDTGERGENVDDSEDEE